MRDASVNACKIVIWHGRPSGDFAMKRHDDLELLRVENGSIVMEVGRTRIKMVSGSVIFFWGLSPHQIVQCDAEALLCRVTIPVAAFVQFQLPQLFTRMVLRGRVIKVDVSNSPRLDKALFRKWVADFPDACKESRSILLLEIEARLRRSRMQ